MKRTLQYIKNLIVPTLVFGLITGALTGTVITLFKFCAAHIISWSESAYAFMRSHVYIAAIFAIVLIAVAIGISAFHKTAPNTKGGGIPTAIGILRGLITFKWYRNLFNVFFASMVTFFIGVPLGNEGPSVQMGTAIGRGTVNVFTRKNRAWDRYVMTGGACAGFAVATGAPISGILFAVEEAHQRISPMIVLVSITSVMFAHIVSVLLSPLLDVSLNLFPEMSLKTLQISELWIPAVIGIVVGLFSTLFIKFHKLLRYFWKLKLSKVKAYIKIYICLFVTLIFGLISYSFISTGHDLILDITADSVPWYMLIAILVFRLTVMLASNSSGITGGMFLPILALGAIISGLIGKTLTVTTALSVDYYSLIVMLGLAACTAGMMKTPLTAITFAVEALSLSQNLISVIIVVALSYMVTEIFGARSINETVIRERVKDIHKNKTPKVIDTYVTVQKGSFVANRQIRDILWPNNLFVLSIQQNEKNPVVDRHGEKFIHDNDVLHIRYSTYDDEVTKKELFALVGEQVISETTVRKI